MTQRRILMTESIRLRSRALLLLSGILLVLCATALLGSSKASAETLSSYCGNQVRSNYEYCVGAQRVLYATYGWGDQHGVCVSASNWAQGYPSFQVGQICTSVASQGVYWPGPGYSYGLYPSIQDNAAGSNRLHGVAYQP